MDYEKVWIGRPDAGHWEFYNGKKFVSSCDENELNETLAELDE